MGTIPVPLSVPSPVAGPAKDSPTDRSLILDLSVDYLDRYAREKDLFCRRAMIYEAAAVCEPVQQIIVSVADDMASDSLYVTPTNSNPSVSDVMQMEHATRVINQMQGRGGGLKDALVFWLEGYWTGKTGAGIVLERDFLDGDVERIHVLHPTNFFPHYGFVNNMPRLYPQDVESTIQGVWWVDGWHSQTRRMHFANAGYWHQTCDGALGNGLFLDCRPKAERALNAVVTHKLLQDYVRRTVNGTDDHSIIVSNGIDPELIARYSKIKQAMLKRKRKGEEVPLKYENMRVWLHGLSDDRPAGVDIKSTRTFPEGFDPLKMLNHYAHSIALSFGVHPKRTSSEAGQDKFGNATLAALGQGDESGVRDAKKQFETMLELTCLTGVGAQVQLVGAGTVAQYAARQVEQLVLQNANVMKALALPDERILEYVTRGVDLMPDTRSDANRTLTPSSSRKWAQVMRKSGNGGYLPLCSADMRLVTIRTKAIGDDEDNEAIDSFEQDWQMCYERALRLYQEWINEELPQNVGSFGLDQAELRRDVTTIATQIATEIEMCARRYAGRSRAQALSNYYMLLRNSFLNRWGPPDERTRGLTQPKNNLYNALSALDEKFLRGRGSNDDLQRVANGYMHDLERYFSAASGARFVADADTHRGPVTWQLDPRPHLVCSDCRTFAGPYENIRALLNISGGRLPRSISLQCAGNCRCKLIKN